MIADNNPQVSIIVPARNEEACLGACLESLVAQTGIGFEIIVVDDDSTDRTAEIAHSFAQEDASIASPGEDARSSTNHVGAALPARPKNLEFGAAGVLARPPVHVISAPLLPANWTGKNNAMSAG